MKKNKLSKTDKKNQKIEKSEILSQEEKTFLKNARLQNTKIVLVFSLNNYDCKKIIQEIVTNYCKEIKKSKSNEKNNIIYNYKYPIVELNTSKFPQLKNKEKYILIPCPRNEDIFLDFCKVADILLTVTTVEHIDLLNLNKNPSDSLNAIDDVGHKAISYMRSQGHLNSVSCVVGLEHLNKKKMKDVKFYFRRLLEEDFPDTRVCFLEKKDDVLKFLMDLMNCNVSSFEWRKKRGYFLVDKIEACGQSKKVYLSGFLKNSWALNENVHITGLGDFQPEHILSEIKKNNQTVLNYFKKNENLDDFSIFNTEGTDVINDNKILDEEEFGEKEKKFDLNMMDLNKDFLDMNVMMENNQEEIIDEEDSLNGGLNQTTILNTTINRTQLNKRDDKDKFFEDEVEYEQNELVRERYRKYKYMKSFTENEWNKFDSLPNYYKKLFRFGNIEKTHSYVSSLHEKNSAFFEGCYITLVFNSTELFDMIEKLDNTLPLIVSSLFRHERKMSLMHCKVRFHNENEKEVFSKKNYLIHSGFRKYNSNIMFSNIYHKCRKFKSVKKIESNYNNWYLGSYFGQVYFPPNNVLMFLKDDENDEMILEENKLNSGGHLKMIGSSLYSDPFKVILKRIILTGYPVKTKKKHAVIKFMFFNPEDVLFYQNNELYTKLGLKGKIKEKIGTHGAMKVLFNNVVKQTDVVCMNLYKRTFPKFN